MVEDIKKGTLGVITIVNTYFMTGFKKHGDVWGKADVDSIRQYNVRLKEYAKKNDLLYADVFRSMDQTDWLVCQDGVHPSDLGHLLIANKVFETIAVNCSCLSLGNKS